MTPPVLRSRPSPDALVVGEALVDIVHRADGSIDESPGGSPANVALALGGLARRHRHSDGPLAGADGARAIFSED